MYHETIWGNQGALQAYLEWLECQSHSTYPFIERVNSLISLNRTQNSSRWDGGTMNARSYPHLSYQIHSTTRDTDLDLEHKGQTSL